MIVWSTLEAACPICSQRIRLRLVGSGFATGQDTDLLLRMSPRHVIQVEVHTCLRCRFSGYAADFLDDIPSAVRRYFLENVSPRLVETGLGHPRRGRGSVRGERGGPAPRALEDRALEDRALAEPSLEEPHRRERASDGGGAREAGAGPAGSRPWEVRRERTARWRGRDRRETLRRTPLPDVQYYWAYRTAAALELPAVEQGQRLLRAYWCLRIPPSAGLPVEARERRRRIYLKGAIRKLREGLSTSNDSHLVYLIAELCRRNGNFRLAAGYFRRYLDAASGVRYLRKAAAKLLAASGERSSQELSMEEVLYYGAPDGG